MRRLTLQILQKSIRKMILRTLAPGVLLALRSAVRTGVFHRILLRIAVQSGPARAAYTYCFYITPVHGIALLGIHVHKGCDALTPHFGTVSRKYSIYKHFEPFPVSIAPTQPHQPSHPSFRKTPLPAKSHNSYYQRSFRPEQTDGFSPRSSANESACAAERLSTLSSILRDRPGTVECCSRLARSRIQSYQQLMCQGHTNHSFRFPFGRHPFRKCCKVRVVAAYHSGHHIQNRSHIAATSAHRSFSFALSAVLRQRRLSRDLRPRFVRERPVLGQTRQPSPPRAPRHSFDRAQPLFQLLPQ